jgi:hypothetical protein
MIHLDEWRSCYARGWGRLIVPSAFEHPAKISFSLAERIYQHMIAEGWLAPDDVVIDPFGGIAGTALHAMQNGLHWLGVELEQKFVDLGNANIDKWDREFGARLPRWGSARLLRGDSRRLLEVISEAGAAGVVSSPPYTQSLERPNGIDASLIKKPGGKHSQSVTDPRYGQTPGQLGAMREGTPPQAAASVSSPPFADQQTGGGLAKPDAVYSGDGHRFGSNHGYQGQGTTPGNLGNLRADAAGFDAALAAEGCVSSPPFESSLLTTDTKFMAKVERDKRNGSRLQPGPGEYGHSIGQLGGESGSDFWSAARVIVAQTFAALRPSGHAVWVVKDFIRAGVRVPFCDQWRMLCESVGFVTLHEHRALLVQRRGKQLAHDGNHKSLDIERKSFFRRLAESKGSPRIDYEVVLCQHKP